MSRNKKKRPTRSSKSRVKEKLLPLSPSMLVRKMFWHFYAMTFPEDQRPAPEPIRFSTGNSTEPFTCPAITFWGKFGQRIVLSESYAKLGRLVVEVPELNAVAEVMVPVLQKLVVDVIAEELGRTEAETEDREAADFASGLDQSGANQAFDAFIAHFDSLTDAEQIAEVNDFRLSAAQLSVWTSIRSLTVEQVEQRRQATSKVGLNSNLVVGIFRVWLQKERQRLNEMSNGLAATLQAIDRFHWEELVAPSKRITEFLPRGVRTAVEKKVDDQERTPVLELEEEALSQPESQIDPERFEFYFEELGCKKVVRAKGIFGEKGYVAFIVRSLSKTRYAILDCPESKNAAYVFRIDVIDDPNEAGWVEESQLTKAEVLARKSEDGPFIRRIFHTSSWKQRVKRFLKLH